MKTLRSFITAGGLVAAAILMPGQTPTASARVAIDAGNQAWIDGIKAGDMQRIAATYTEDAVDCGRTGRVYSRTVPNRAAYDSAARKPRTSALCRREDTGIDGTRKLCL